MNVYIRSWEGGECMAGLLPHLPAPELQIFCKNHDLSRGSELDAFVIDIGNVKSQNLENVALGHSSWRLTLPIYHDRYDAWNNEKEPKIAVQVVTLYNMYSRLTNFLFNFDSAITASYRRLWVNAFKVEYSLQDGWVIVDVKLDPENEEYKILTASNPPFLGASLSHLATFFDVSVFKV